MHKCFINTSQINGRNITLDDTKELHHMRDVLRLGIGDKIICCSDDGKDHLASIVKSTKTALVLAIERVLEPQGELLQICLCPALLKSDRFDWIVQKATELGVFSISPLLTEHTVVKIEKASEEKKLKRWNKISLEAAKQCKRSSIPIIEPIRTLGELFSSLPKPSYIIMPTLATTSVSIKEIINRDSQPNRVHLLIGPEGDFSKKEILLAQSYGVNFVSLGHLVLRSETACVASIAMLRYQLEL
jgi:16S rRNA (uracil1498-N3)-methyltransferase